MNGYQQGCSLSPHETSGCNGILLPSANESTLATDVSYIYMISDTSDRYRPLTVEMTCSFGQNLPTVAAPPFRFLRSLYVDGEIFGICRLSFVACCEQRLFHCSLQTCPRFCLTENAVPGRRTAGDSRSVFEFRINCTSLLSGNAFPMRQQWGFPMPSPDF